MRILLGIVSLSTLLALPSSALAISYNSATTAASWADPALTAEANSDIGNVIGTVVGALLGLLGVIFLVLTIYAGVLWMTAGGNTDNVKKAKQILGNAVIGLILTVTSYAITYFVIGLAS